MELFDSINQLNESRRKTTRRKFLVGGAGLIASYYGYRWWRDRPRPIANRETKYVTENDDFYAISIDVGFESNASKKDWRLELAGLDGKPTLLTYDQLLGLERKRVYKTFMCVGNEVGGPAIGNAEWTVTPLAPLLHPLVKPGTQGLRVVFHGLDGFYSSVPLEVALDEHSFIAYEMNGVELPDRHGFPARVLLPNIYGMKQPRWLKRIELNADGESGYWEKRGWCGECPIKSTARIDAAIDQKNGDWLLTGIAYCGGQAVGKVEWSSDEGVSWQQAKITSPQYKNAWATWEANWHPLKKGEHIVTARVTDERGGRQIESYDGNFPSGSSGLHRVIIKI